MTALPLEYPREHARRLDSEWRVYDDYYESSMKIERPFFSHNEQRERRFVDALAKHFALQRSSAIVDIGCGNGLYARLFHECGLRVTAVDRSGRAIAFCRERYPDSCGWVCADASGLDQRGQHDYAFTFWFMYFNAFEKPGDGVEAGCNLTAYLKPAGRLFFLWPQ